MDIVSNKIVNLENEVLSKIDEALELMCQHQAERLKFCKNNGMPNNVFSKQASLQMARFNEIKNALKIEYFSRFHNEMHFEAPGMCAVIPSKLSEDFTNVRRAENLEAFGENYL